MSLKRLKIFVVYNKKISVLIVGMMVKGGHIHCRESHLMMHVDILLFMPMVSRAQYSYPLMGDTSGTLLTSQPCLW